MTACIRFLSGLLASLFLLGAAFASEDVDGMSSASARLYADRPFRIGIISLSEPYIQHNEFIAASVERLQKAFSPYSIEFREYKSRDLEEAVRSKSIDAFIASSGFFWRMQKYGVRDIATLIARDRPDPNHTSALAFITKSERTDIRTIADMKGLRLSASYPSAFMGYRIGLAEIASAGHDPDTFFSSVSFTQTPALEAISNKVLDGRTDVAFVQACWLEKLRPERRARFRVIAPKTTPNFPCLHSTEAYPNITVAILQSAAPGAAREISRLLLTMPEFDDGTRWGLATDFRSIDRVYRLLKIENYAYLRDKSLRQWIEAHRHWLVVAGFCLVLLVLHSFVLSALVRRRTNELERATEEKLAAQKRLDAMHVRMEQIRKASIVSQLSSMIAHELAQPVGAALTYSEGLRLLADEGTLTDDKLDRSLGGIRRSLARIQHIVEKVRSYSRGNVDRDARLNLAEVVTTARDSLSQSLRQALAIDITVDPALFVTGDRLELELLFNNLLSNAVTAAIKTPAPAASVRAEAIDGGVLVVVENSGRILTQEEVSAFTLPFISEKGPDHGLGIPISLSLAEANGGHLAFAACSEGGIRAELVLRRAG